jgi:hypothetical protein
MKKILKKYKWFVVGSVLAVAGVAACFIFRHRDVADVDAMFYEVKCTFRAQDANYSLIVDDRKAARAFMTEMENTTDPEDRADSCRLIRFSRATTPDLFVYSVMTVLKGVTFAFKDEIISRNFYQVQYFTAQDEVAALSCDYAGDRFDCYDVMPAGGLCPDTLADAKKQLSDKCDFVESK